MKRIFITILIFLLTGMVSDIAAPVNNPNMSITEYDLVNPSTIRNNCYTSLHTSGIDSIMLYRYISLPDSFFIKLNNISDSLHISPTWLFQIFWNESGLNPRAVNKATGAVGFIQLMPSTFRWMKRVGHFSKSLSLSDIAKMSATSQLDIVYKYFDAWGYTYNSVYDLYMVTFFPKAINRGDSYIFKTKTMSAKKIAHANKGFDINRDGKIQKFEVKQFIAKKYKLL